MARALARRGIEVRCLVREGSTLRRLEGVDATLRPGDLLDPASLERAAAGCRALFHCAADYRLWAPAPDDILRTNVEGTRNVLRAAEAAGVARVVHTSSVGALAGGTREAPADESGEVDATALVGPYKRSKYLAEREAAAFAERGLDVVIVNPSTPVGEGDVKPTPTGKVIVDFLRGRMPAYVDTGLNIIDVRDVAEGHVLAALHGRTGERYILGNRNMSLRELLEALASIAGRGAPRVRLPHWIPLVAAHAAEAWAGLAGGEPAVSLAAVRMARQPMYFDAGKAVRELGLPQSPIEPALERAVAWFRAHGYA